MQVLMQVSSVYYNVYGTHLQTWKNLFNLKITTLPFINSTCVIFTEKCHASAKEQENNGESENAVQKDLVFMYRTLKILFFLTLMFIPQCSYGHLFPLLYIVHSSLTFTRMLCRLFEEYTVSSSLLGVCTSGN